MIIKEVEARERYKMYKAKKQWLIAGAAMFGLLAGGNAVANADTTTPTNNSQSDVVAQWNADPGSKPTEVWKYESQSGPYYQQEVQQAQQPKVTVDQSSVVDQWNQNPTSKPTEKWKYESQSGPYYNQVEQLETKQATVQLSDQNTGQSKQTTDQVPADAVAQLTDGKYYNYQQVGIDLNTDNFLTTSEGNVVANPRFYRTIKGRLAKAQRKLSRRQVRAKKEGRSLRDSKNYQKQRMVVSKLMNRVRNQRNKFLDEMSITLIKNHDLVVAENLRSKNLLKNHALAMSISDVGWRIFLQKLEYKAELYGKTFVTINPKNTTQTCNKCGHVMGTKDTDKLTLKDRSWTCPVCNTYHIRDVNAAKNILDKGLEQLA